MTSRIPELRTLPPLSRRERLAEALSLTEDRLFGDGFDLPDELADQMVENSIGSFRIPLGVALNFVVNGRDYIVPMAIEEPSVIAAASLAAKIVRSSGGFNADVDPPILIGQIQISDCDCPDLAAARVLSKKAQILSLANETQPNLVRRGGGALDLEVRQIPTSQDSSRAPILVLHLLVDTRDAMGANLVNTMVESITPAIEQISLGRANYRILSNLSDRRLARAECRVQVASLATAHMPGDRVAQGIVDGSLFAEADPYRAATHNKGIMNGIDPVAIATGQDWRAIEAGAHAFACRDGRYKPLSRWRIEGDELVGHIEVPMSVGTVGGATKLHPQAQMALRLMRISSSSELAMVIASVGLAQNLAALKALGSTGIQNGHMKLHARSVAATAGAKGPLVAIVADEMVRFGDIKVERARSILTRLVSEQADTPKVDS